MNSVNEKKEVVMRGLAVAGLVALICLIAWLSVQIIKVAPSAFSSLASLAEGISQYEDTLSESEPKDIFIHKELELVDSGNQTTLSWSKVDQAGTFAFSYACAEGVSIAVLNEDGVRDIECDTNYNLGNTNELTVIAESTEERYVDVAYTITHTLNENDALYGTGSATLTVTNRSIPDFLAEADEDDVTFGPDDVDTETETEEPVTQTNTPANNNQTAGAGYSYEYEYKIPVSNPNGNINLQATFVSVGGIVNNRYTAGKLEQDSTGAIQFAVKNIGTRTSEDWDFTITLPDGSTYESDTQNPLKPNERATLTIGIETGNKSSHTFKVTVDTDDDISKLNNSFSRAVSIQR